MLRDAFGYGLGQQHMAVRDGVLDATDDVIIRDNATQIARPVAARGDRKLHGKPNALRDALLFTPYADADRQDEIAHADLVVWNGSRI
jgi:hypothetical protein